MRWPWRTRLTVPHRLRQGLGVNDGDVRAAIDQLVRQGYVTETKAGKGATYRLAPAGEAHLKTLEPPPATLNETLLPYQKAFILLKLFLTKSRTLTQAEVEEKVRARDAIAYLEFGSVAVGDDGEGKATVDSRLVAAVLESLARQGALTRKKNRGVMRYELTEQGEELLVASDQYPSFEFQFRMTGRTFNQFREVMRHGLAIPVEEPKPQPPPPPAAPLPPPAVLTPETIVRLVDELLSDKYDRRGSVPIWELRRLVGVRVGPEAARHDVLDPLLKRLRREGRVRLVAIGDRSRATPEQLDESIPGDNETFFFIEVAHEHAALG